MKNLYIESCLDTLKRNLEYDYVVASPPDFNELKKDTEDSSWTYSDFLKTFAELLKTVNQLGEGGMGVVYRAMQSRLNRIVAVKMILTGQLAGDDEVRRFHAEAEAAAIMASSRCGWRR